jgi:CMP-N-acetylneuraminic acid synthetase
MRILVTICGRGGSKGIPGKNIKPLSGRPLIDYTIRAAKEFQKKYGEVVLALSTDSSEILNVASECGLETDYLRPGYLGGDTIGKIDVIADVLLWEEAKNKCRFDYILDLDITSPLRNLDDLSNAFGTLQMNESALNLFSVSPAARNPYFNMVEQKENGFFALVKKPDETLKTRQSSPKVYDLNASFYFYRRSFFEEGYKSAITERSLIYEMPHICFDLDHSIDFEIIDFLLKNNRLDFNL